MDSNRVNRREIIAELKKAKATIGGIMIEAIQHEEEELLSDLGNALSHLSLAIEQIRGSKED